MLKTDATIVGAFIICTGAVALISEAKKKAIKQAFDKYQSYKETGELNNDSEKDILLPGKIFGDFLSLTSNAWNKTNAIALDETKIIEVPVGMIIKYIEVKIYSGHVTE